LAAVAGCRFTERVLRAAAAGFLAACFSGVAAALAGSIAGSGCSAGPANTRPSG